MAYHTSTQSATRGLEDSFFDNRSFAAESAMDIEEYEVRLAKRQAEARAWTEVWNSLTPEKQNEWHQFTPAERDATYKMSAKDFAKFMADLDADPTTPAEVN